MAAGIHFGDYYYCSPRNSDSALFNSSYFSTNCARASGFQHFRLRKRPSSAVRERKFNSQRDKISIYHPFNADEISKFNFALSECNHSIFETNRRRLTDTRKCGTGTATLKGNHREPGHE